MDAFKKYYAQWVSEVGAGWNRFWFSHSDVFPLAVMRILVGLAAIYFVASYSLDLVRWFGKDGLLPMDVVTTINTELDITNPDITRLELPPMRPTYLSLVDGAATLWIIHLIGMAILAAFTVGAYTRVTSILSFVVILSYINRAPILTGQFEPVLTAMLFYLCIAPAGYCLSIDQRLREKRNNDEDAPKLESLANKKSMVATIALRLMQVHLSLLYVVMGLSKLIGMTWIDGSGIWMLLARSESRILDVSFLHRVPEIVFLWSHAIIIFEIAFGILIWNRHARPLLLVLAVPMWLSLGLVTGLMTFSLMMLVASLIFVSPESLRAGWNWTAAKLRINLQVDSEESVDAELEKVAV